MVHQQRHHRWWRKSNESIFEGENLSHAPAVNPYIYRRKRPRLVLLLFLSLIFCCFIFFTFPSAFSLFYNFGIENGIEGLYGKSVCSSMSNGTLCCDRSSARGDICFLKGDIRTQSSSSSIFLYNSTNSIHEKIKPYTRKWEPSVMDTVGELNLISMQQNQGLRCDVFHKVPAIFFSTSGYTGNLYHEFNDGIIPLYITSRHMNRKVILFIIDFHNWWISKYGDIVSILSDYPPIDFKRDERIHCFPEAIVGLKIHGDLTVISSSSMNNKISITDFRNLLDAAYTPRIRSLEKAESQILPQLVKNPKLVILSRNGSRAIANEDSVAAMAEGMGFSVEIVRPERTTELAKVFRVLNSSDVMMGVHGAALTHFLFLKPGSVFIQVIPLGVDWAADTYFQEPARKYGLKYIPYRIVPTESSLYSKYDEKNPILKDPQIVAKLGWHFTKEIYLDDQILKLDLKRFKKSLVGAYEYTMARRIL